jgi:hypothetical protein
VSELIQNDIVRIYSTPKGPHVYFGDHRVHHWTVGLIATVVGALGLIFDKNKNRKPLYAILCVGGTIAFLDDLPDFIHFLETS